MGIFKAGKRDTLKPKTPLEHRSLQPQDSRGEVRCAVRFPLRLPAVLSAGAKRLLAQTRNVSANGVLFELDNSLSVGQDIDFSLQMPGGVFGTPRDVMVRCHGRVVRCSLSQGFYQAAATIDGYQFVEQ
ncbi:MAG: PilZ domain-containing protein [Acidobacteriota bacterium]|nr:PilZ domain-containing protein [Acidobacteriota bacterium]